MANTYSNSVVIEAPVREVEQYLVDISIGDYRFNMAKLFPEQFPVTDKSGEDSWASAWCCEATGSPTLPEVDISDRWDESTLLIYETEYGPNTGTIERLHKLTNRDIKHYSEEPLLDDDMWVMTCENGTCTYDTQKQDTVIED